MQLYVLVVHNYITIFILIMTIMVFIDCVSFNEDTFHFDNSIQFSSNYLMTIMVFIDYVIKIYLESFNGELSKRHF